MRVSSKIWGLKAPGLWHFNEDDLLLRGLESQDVPASSNKHYYSKPETFPGYFSEAGLKSEADQPEHSRSCDFNEALYPLPPRAKNRTHMV